MTDQPATSAAAMKPLDYCPICRDRLRAPNNECPRHGKVTPAGTAACSKRQQKIEKAMRCSLCAHDWFAHDFDHPTANGCPCRDCEGGVCVSPTR